EPICVASLMRCDSPPLNVLAERLRVKYSNPTSRRNFNLSVISFKIGFAIIASLPFNFTFLKNSSSFKMESEVTSVIFFPWNFTASDSFFNLPPPHAGHGTVFMYDSTHSRILLEEVVE